MPQQILEIDFNFTTSSGGAPNAFTSGNDFPGINAEAEAGRARQDDEDRAAADRAAGSSSPLPVLSPLASLIASLPSTPSMSELFGDDAMAADYDRGVALEAEVEAKSRELAATRGDLASQNREIESLRDQIEARDAQLESHNRSITKLMVQADQAREAVEQEKAATADVQDSLKRVNADYEQSSKEHRRAVAQRNDLEAQLQVSQAKLNSLRQQWEEEQEKLRAVDDYKSQVTELEEHLDGLREELEAEHRQIEERDRTIQVKDGRIQHLEGQLQRALTNIANAQADAEAARPTSPPAIVSAGESLEKELEALSDDGQLEDFEELSLSAITAISTEPLAPVLPTVQLTSTWTQTDINLTATSTTQTDDVNLTTAATQTDDSPTVQLTTTASQTDDVSLATTSTQTDDPPAVQLTTTASQTDDVSFATTSSLTTTATQTDGSAPLDVQFTTSSTQTDGSAPLDAQLTTTGTQTDGSALPSSQLLTPHPSLLSLLGWLLLLLIMVLIWYQVSLWVAANSSHHIDRFSVPGYLFGRIPVGRGRVLQSLLNRGLLDSLPLV